MYGGHYPDNDTVYGNICVTEYSSLLWLQLIFLISIGINIFCNLLSPTVLVCTKSTYKLIHVTQRTNSTDI
jgi:hypothetical protein